MRYLFLDESGDHNLHILDPQYPVFVLAGCIVEEKYHADVVVPEINKFKAELFDVRSPILHYVDYTRNQNGFESMKDKGFREKFYCKLNEIIAKVDFTLLACVIDKRAHKEKYGFLAVDPYVFALEVLVERFVMYLKGIGDKGCIVAESRGNQLDNELELAFLNLKIKGTRYLRPKDISECVTGFFIKRKEENIAGLQLADTLVTPIGRRYLEKRNFYLDYESIKNKFRKIQCGKYMGYGLMLVPKNKSGQPPLRSDRPEKTP